MRYTPSGSAVTSFSVASNRKWRNQNGEQQEQTDWFRVSCWGNLAENANQYLTKGKQVYIRGREDIREYDDRDGNRRWNREVHAFDLQFLGGGQGGDSSGGNRQNQGYQNQGQQRQNQGGNQQRQQQPQDDDGWDDVDDLPF